MTNENESLIQLIDKKWDRVRHYYEAIYKDPQTGAGIRFKQRPPDEKVEWLYDQMRRLGITEQVYLHHKK